MGEQILNYVGFIVLLFVIAVSLFKPVFALYLLPYAFSLSPEIIVSQTAAREVTIRIEDLLTVTLLLKIFFDFLISKSFPLERFRKNQFFLPMFLYSFVLIIATTLGMAQGYVSPASGFFFVTKLIQFFLFFFMFLYYISDKKDIKVILNSALLTMGIVTIIGIIQIPTFARTTMPFEGESYEPNTFGGYYVLLGSVVAGLYTHEPKGRKKVIYALLLAAAVMPFIYTLSRSSWIAAGFALITFLLLTKGLQRKVVIFMVLLLLVLSIPFMPGAIRERAEFWKAEEGFGRTETIGGTKFDASTSERITRYREMVDIFIESPVLGRGMTGAGFIDGQYIRVINETGIVGVFAFSYLFYAILKYLYSSYKNTVDPFVRSLSLGLFCATIGLLIHSLGASTFLLVRVTEPYMMFLALLVGYDRMTEGEEKVESHTVNQIYIYPYLITAPVKSRAERT
ncbi:MAG: O-antigen ligase family protein [Deltaproteobacteria bacterium]|nr:O-antigen ligase family protein [Deltaproteobacteria bacterium]